MNEEKHYDVEAVKQRLIDLRDLRREIENQSERLERLETKLVGVGAQALTDMPKSPSPSNDRISDLMQQKFDLEEDIRATLEHRRRERMFFEKIIRRLKRSDERAVIRSRYLDGASWGDVVDLLYGDEEDLLEREDMYRKRVFKLHGRALLSMAQYIEDNGLMWNPSYTAGLYDLPYGQLVASRGLGNQFPAFRLFNRPDVPVVVLE